jgi:hypothetical protein
MKTNYGKYKYQRKSSEVIHQIVDEHDKLSKTEMMILLQELRVICCLEVFFPLTKAMRESKEINKIEYDNYFKIKEYLDETEDDEHEQIIKDLDYQTEELLNSK